MISLNKIISTLISANAVLNEQVTDSSVDMDIFIETLGIVESDNNDNAVGDNGNALGRYQIWKIYWQDAVEFDPSIGGEYEDVTNPDYARKIVEAYMSRYATKKRLGHEPTFEDMARIHNGGPNGHKKDSTDIYWNRFEPVLINVIDNNEVEDTPSDDEFDYSSYVPDPNVIYLEPQKVIPGSWR